MRIAVIVGTGLLGSSFGLAVKRAGLFDRVIGVSSPAVVQKALDVGAVDEALPLAEAVPLGDLVLLAQPVRRILTLIQSLNELLRPGALVTDVGSTKAEICAAGARHLTRGQFVGGHPMAGREVRGPEGATADLFIGRPWVLTTTGTALTEIVTALGASPVFLDPAAHDRMVAFSSHLPQLLSTCLAAYLSGHDVKQVAGPGLLDMTRLAQSSYELWEDILLTNQGNVESALDGLIGEMQSFRRAVGQGNASSFFERAGQSALKLRTP